jgi:hypothetical protein
MTRADFWCRVVGWVQLAASIGFTLFVVFLWKTFARIFEIEDVAVVDFLLWFFVFVTVFPMFVTGLLTVIFANAVEQARNGLRDQGRIVLRVFLALSGLWAAGIIGYAGVAVPAFSVLALLALVSVAVAIMGPDLTADLLTPRTESA